MKAMFVVLMLAALSGCASEAPPSWKGMPFHPINPPASASAPASQGVAK